MRTTHRISTGQFEYVEIEHGTAQSPGQTRIDHDEWVAAFKPQTGILDKEFNAFVDAMLLNEPNHTDVWEKLSDKQKDTAQTIKRALKRLEAREGKPLRDRNTENQ